MTDSQIEFQNIESSSLRQQAKDLIDEITQLSPSDAAVRATFRFIQDKFLVDIRIASENVFMQAAEQAEVVSELLEGVKTKLLSQIIDWRNHRFAS